MNVWEKIILTLVVGIAGGYVGYYLKIPAGAMIGSMVFVAILNIFWGKAYMPAQTNNILQVAAGIMIGVGVTKADILGLKEIAIPALIVAVGVVILNFAIGFAIAKFSTLDMATALFSSAPGGLQQMTIIAGSMNADVSKVAILQTLRLITTVALIPVLLKGFLQSGMVK